MTRSATGIAAIELADLLDLVERLSRLVPKFTAALTAAQLERDKLLSELSRQAAKSHPVRPRSFTHLGNIVRWLRETAGLTRRQLAAQTGISDATLKNIETNRHKLTATTLHKLLAHPTMAALPKLAKEAGLSLGLGNHGRTKQ